MIKNIVKGKQIFTKKATPATEADTDFPVGTQGV